MQNNTDVAQQAREPVLRPETEVQALPSVTDIKVLWLVALSLILLFIFSFWGVVYYYPDPGGAKEQAWLDKAISHLREVARISHNDPELCNALCYTIVRYDRIGRLDVAFRSLRWVNTHQIDNETWSVVMGQNDPKLPGLILDPDVMTYPIHKGAGVLLHEALHDYWPYYGHAHVTPIMNRYTAKDR